MQISHSKCNILQIGSSDSSHTFHFVNNTIQQVDSVIDLGVTIDNKLHFKYHINNITLKANQHAALINAASYRTTQTISFEHSKYTCALFSNTPPLHGRLHTFCKSLKLKASNAISQKLSMAANIFHIQID